LLHVNGYRRAQPRGLAKEIAQALAHNLFGSGIQRIEARAQRGKFHGEIDPWQRAAGRLVNLRNTRPSFGKCGETSQQINVALLHRERLSIAHRGFADDVKCERSRFFSQLRQHPSQVVAAFFGDKAACQLDNVTPHDGGNQGAGMERLRYIDEPTQGVIDAGKILL
jgi:hypothetical protein